MKLLVLLFFCSCLGLNTRAQLHPCVSPPFMTGNAYMHTEVGALMTSGTFDYDALGQQIRIRSSGINPSGTFSMDLLIQFLQGRTWFDILKVVYKIDYSERKCQKMALDVAFNPIQIPPGSFPVAQTILGTGSVDGMGLLANMWYGEIPETQAMYTMVFSDNACVPLSGTYFSPQSGTIIMSFYNILLGVRDPMDFIPPYFCQKEELKKMEDLPKTNFYRLLSAGNK